MKEVTKHITEFFISENISKTLLAQKNDLGEHLLIKVKHLLAGVSQQALHYIVNKYRLTPSFLN